MIPPSTTSDLPRVHDTLKALQNEIHEIRARIPPRTQTDELESMSRSLKRQQKIAMPLMWIVGIIGTVFSAGMAAQLILGKTATDEEMLQAVGVHAADELAHPDLAKQLDENTQAVRSIEGGLRMIDKRTQYQFEYARWLSDVIEAKNAKRQPPPRPAHVKQLEDDLMLGRY